MSRVEVVHWNPRRTVRVLGRGVPTPRRVGNFGDLVGPRVVAALLAERGLGPGAARPARLLTVGSILRLARDGDTVWGSGVNGKSLDAEHPARRLDVRAVRGPLTREHLARRGIDVPEVYGDPGLLVGRLGLVAPPPGGPRRELTVVPNLNDLDHHDLADPRVLDPRRPLAECLAVIADSAFVTGSSLHGVVVAEALGVGARLVASRAEPAFKYEDYYLGSGRAGFTAATTARDAAALGPEPAPRWDPAPLLAAFPADLWTGRRAPVTAPP